MFVIWEGWIKTSDLGVLWDHNRKSKIGYPYSIRTKQGKYCNHIDRFYQVDQK